MNHQDTEGFKDDAVADELCRRVIGAAIEVHRELGPGYLESLYEEALAIELTASGVPFVRQPEITVKYRNVDVGHGRMDLLVGGRLVVELKAVESLLPIHSAQVISYLRATGLHVGLLLNFNVSVLKAGVKRIAL